MAVSMTKDELKERTMKFALELMQLVDDLPHPQKGRVVTFQLVKAATSVRANYRAACRGRSKAEYLSKLQTVLEDSDESHFWLELIYRTGHLAEGKVRATEQESNELTAIFNSPLYRGRNNNE